MLEAIVAEQGAGAMADEDAVLAALLQALVDRRRPHKVLYFQ